MTRGGMEMTARDMPAVILAGGQGRRIGGDKAQVLLAGRPLWQHVRARIAPQVTRLAVNGRGAFEGVEMITDAVPGLGPLGGILAAMNWAERCGAQRVLTVAVDTPFLPLDLLARLAAEDARVVVAETADGVHGTTALWDVALAGALQQALDGGTRKVTDFAAEAVPVRFPDTTPPAFFNVNTPEDLARAEAWV